MKKETDNVCVCIYVYGLNEPFEQDTPRDEHFVLFVYVYVCVYQRRRLFVAKRAKVDCKVRTQ